MSDLIKRQEVIEAFTEMNRMGLNERDIIHEFETMPSADAVEVVRCKDCTYFDPITFTGKCELRRDFIFTNDFCSYAVERRTDE